jgi:hypothetical protein
MRKSWIGFVAEVIIKASIAIIVRLAIEKIVQKSNK